jgi:hypothetical protein
MADDYRKLITMVGESQRVIDRMDARLAREVVTAYEQARRELLGRLAEAYARLGDDPTPEAVRSLLSQESLVESIEERIAALTRDVGGVVREQVTQVVEGTYESARAEIRLIAQNIGVVGYIPLGVNPLLELAVRPALAAVPGLSNQVRDNLILTLRVELAKGSRLREITAAMYGKESSVFARGMTSAQLMTHRAVAEAENTARLAFNQHAAQSIPKLQKQAIARIDDRTSKTCLDVHGQIADLDKPFDLRGGFGRASAPPFHWGPCRTAVVAYHPDFERNSAFSTADLKQEAATQRRSNER